MEKQLKKLRRALGRLNQTQGAVARRSARRSVLAMLTSIRRRVDKEFPAFSRPKRKLSNDKNARRRRLQRAGWVPFSPTHDNLVALAVASISIKKDGWGATMCPAWAAYVLENVKVDERESTLRNLKHSPKARSAFMVEHFLAHDLDEKPSRRLTTKEEIALNTLSTSLRKPQPKLSATVRALAKMLEK